MTDYMFHVGDRFEFRDGMYEITEIDAEDNEFPYELHPVEFVKQAKENEDLWDSDEAINLRYCASEQELTEKVIDDLKHVMRVATPFGELCVRHDEGSEILRIFLQDEAKMSVDIAALTINKSGAELGVFVDQNEHEPGVQAKWSPKQIVKGFRF